jgi:uncharacterized phiE125 gp8 family phage protein
MSKPATASPLRWKVITPATEEPISLEDCRSHLEAQPYYDSDVDPQDDHMILAWLAAAREYCEQFTGLVIGEKTIEVALDEFPTGAVELPVGPLVSMTSVSIGEGSDAEIDEVAYTVDDYSKPPRIVPVTTWPTMTGATNAVKIRYVAGYGDDSDSLPLPFLLRAAMLLILGHLYENRENSTDKAMQTIPTGADALMRPLRIRMGMA